MTIRSEIMAFPLELKAASAETGKFSGYAAVFNGLDQIRDTVLPGAFRDTIAEWKATGRKLPMHLNHGLPALGGRRGIGGWDVVEEDSRGLYVEGTAVGMNTDTGRYLFEQVKSGAFGGLSIGFNVRPNGEIRHPGATTGPRRTIKAVNLREISVVDDPCDTEARITDIKSALGLDTIGARMARGEDVTEREIEDALREKLDLSNSLARRLATGGVKSLLARESAEGKANNPLAGTEARALRDLLAGFMLPN